MIYFSDFRRASLPLQQSDSVLSLDGEYAGKSNALKTPVLEIVYAIAGVASAHLTSGNPPERLHA